MILFFTKGTISLSLLSIKDETTLREETFFVVDTVDERALEVLERSKVLLACRATR
jgi:hypothetical protein